MDKLSCSYGVGAFDGKTIKLGHTENIVERLKQHRKNGLRGMLYPKVLFYTQASWDTEQDIKAYFAQYALPGETEIFYNVPELFGWCNWMRQLWASRHDERGVAVPDLEDVSKWFPHPGRISFEEKEIDLIDLSSDDVWGKLPDSVRYPHEVYVAPESYIAVVRDVFGGVIDLDPASNAFANSFVQATRYYNDSMNGLILPWSGNVWLCPPFEQTEKWFNKAVEELHAGRAHEIIGLVDFEKLNSGYFQKFFKHIKVMCLTSTKVKWTDKPQSKSEDSAPRHGYIFVYMGESPERFERVMTATIGTCWYPAALK